MYKVAHKLQQSRIDRIWLKQMPPGEVPLTPEQRKDHLQLCVRRLEDMIKTEGDKEVRRKLGQQKLLIQNQLHDLNKILGSLPPRDVGAFMLELFRKRSSKSTWKQVCTEAHELLEQHEAARKAAFARLPPLHSIEE